MNGNSSSASSFCTMGGMAMNHGNSNEMNMKAHNVMPSRRLGNEYHHQDISNEGDMPVILPGDDKSKNEDSNNDHMHDHNNNMNHDTMDGSTHNHNNSNMSHVSNMNMNGGTIMYMDGFRFALFPPSSSPPPPCLNLLHPSWTLDTQSKFIFAMFFLTLMGMLVEACGVWRVKCLRKGRNIRKEIALKRLQAWEKHQQYLQSQNAIQDSQIEFRRQSQQNGGLQRGVSDISDVSERVIGGPLPNETTATTSTKSILCPAIIRRAWRKVPTSIQKNCSRICCCGLILRTDGDSTTAAKRCDVAAATLHAGRAVLGYMLMLAVMSYAVEFLICAVLGMVLGRYWFVDSGNGSSSGGGGVMNGAVGVGGGIGGMGLGDAVGRQNSDQGLHMNITDLQGNDAMWGGGDPCCGIDDDEDDNNHNQSRDDLRKPLLSSLLGSNTGGITRRSGGQQTDIP